jgi:cell wall-associated NlpC family hydrolase
MTTMHTSSARRSTRSRRGALVALLTGAGVVFTPLVAQASAPGGPPVAAPAVVVAPNAAAQRVVDTALAQQGKPYVWAAAGPGSFDCSGLSQFAYRAAGLALPHSSSGQSRLGRPVAKADLRPGDLIFFYSPVGHVGIYIGGGKMVHAPTSGDVVRVADVNTMPGYNTARRLV